MPADLHKNYPYLSNTTADIRSLGLAVMLNPFADRVSAQRLTMFSNHLNQAQVIKGNEFPRIFSGYESIVGKYEHDLSARDQDVQILGVVPRFTRKKELNSIKDTPYTTYIYRGDKDGLLGYFNVYKYTQRTSGYGYTNKLMNLDYLSKGSFIPQELKFLTSPAHHGQMYNLGTNLKSCFLAIPQITKDAFVISESAAKKLSSEGIDTITINISPNQIPVNIYGDNDYHKMIPDIGEQVGDDGILCALRSPTESSILYDLSAQNLKHVQHLHDSVFYAPPGATIIDVDVVINRKCKVKDSSNIFEQLYKYRRAINDYCFEISKIYDELKSEYRLRPELNTLITNCHASLMVDGQRPAGYPKRLDLQAFNKRERIEFIRLVVTYKYEHKVNRGFKITNRSGGKGTICAIRNNLFSSILTVMVEM